MDPEDPNRATVDEVGEKLRRKDLKRQIEAARPLDSWERYRALNDATDEAYDLIDISNREARFALIVMGGLNALLFVVATRSDLPRQLTPTGRTLFSVAIGLYALLAAYFLFQAIELLRPRRFHPHRTFRRYQTMKVRRRSASAITRTSWRGTSTVICRRGGKCASVSSTRSSRSSSTACA